MMLMRVVPIMLLLVLAAAGCAPRPGFPPPEPESKPAPEPEPSEPAPESSDQTRPSEPEPSSAPRSAAEASGRAVVALLEQGDSLASAGKYQRAAATIERALDVEPRNAFVYQRLARLRLAQGQPGQAETLARKSNSLGGDNPYLRADNWALIAEALRAQGDTVAADSAVSRAEFLRGRTH